MWIRSFAAPDTTLAIAGGKAANLAALTQAGFAVPGGFIVTTAAYSDYVASNALQPRILAYVTSCDTSDAAQLEQTSGRIRELFGRGTMPTPLQQAILGAYSDLADSGSAVAVRSSATAEDLPGMSFAGQQDTYLNIIGGDALLDAVQRCWASLWTARAIAYRARNGIAPDSVSLAVIVQLMCPALVSGVLFTANPVTGNRDEAVLDASYGLGEAIVSGQVDPDHYVVSQASGEILSRKVGSKAIAIEARPEGGTNISARASGTASAAALNDAQVSEIVRTGLRVARHFGAPQDIEWAWADSGLYLLQSRAITSLYPLPEGGNLIAEDGVPRFFFSFNSVQGVTDPFTPLGLDILRCLFGGVLKLIGVQRPLAHIMRAAGGRLYIDFTDMVRDPHLRKLSLRALSAVDPGARDSLRELIALGRIPERKVLSPRSALRTFVRLAPRFAAAAGAMLRPERAARQVTAVCEAAWHRTRQQIDAAPSLPSLLDTIETSLGDALRNMFKGLVRIAPALLMLRVIDGRLGSWLGEAPGTALKLTRGLQNNVTTQMNLSLWSVAQQIRADAPSVAAFAQHSTPGLVDAFAHRRLPGSAQAALEAFVDRYGMRGAVEIDVGRERWRDDPTPILQTVRGYLALPDPGQAPDLLFENAANNAERLATDFVTRARRLRGGWLRAGMLRAMIRRVRLLAGLRESPKFYIVHITNHLRRALLRHGQRLAGDGSLARPDDIFYVPLATLRDFALGGGNLRAVVDVQRAAYAAEQRRRQMPRLLLGNGEAYFEGVTVGAEADPGDGELRGQAVSPGVAEGVVRVVLDPKSAELRPGDILVCPATDPGWTPLFLTAGALVMEIGGVITHGSVVAREYGIPAVVGVQGATTRLKSGQRVRVDGSRGRIVVLED